jgi:hypothetical protein
MSQTYRTGQTPKLGDKVRNHDLLGRIPKGATGTIYDVLWEDPNPLIVMVTWDEYSGTTDCLAIGLDLM